MPLAPGIVALLLAGLVGIVEFCAIPNQAVAPIIVRGFAISQIPNLLDSR